MRSLPLVLLASATLAACGQPPPSPEDPGAVQPFSLGEDESNELSLALASDGEALLHLDGSVEGAGWGTANAESVTLEVIVDHRVLRHLIWTSPWGPEEVSVGTLAAGPHQVKLTRVAASTRAHAAALNVSGASLVLAPDQELQRYAPILLGRDDSNFTDIPVVLYGRRRADNALVYTVVYTNEDGGTGSDPRVLVADWGRLSDIEWALTVERAADGSVTRRMFQGVLHIDVEYAGALEGDHAQLRVATKNGVFADDGKRTPFRLALPVTPFDDSKDEPRERAMDLLPWTHELVDLEGRREGKVDPACADPAKVWAVDCYAYVDVRAEAALAAGRRVWGLEAKTSAGTTVRSELNLGALGRLDRSGNVRVALPVGRGVDVTEVRAYAVDDGQGAFTVKLSDARLRRYRSGRIEEVGSSQRSVEVGPAAPDALLWP